MYSSFSRGAVLRDEPLSVRIYVSSIWNYRRRTEERAKKISPDIERKLCCVLVSLKKPVGLLERKPAESRTEGLEFITSCKKRRVILIEIAAIRASVCSSNGEIAIASHSPLLLTPAFWGVEWSKNSSQINGNCQANIANETSSINRNIINPLCKDCTWKSSLLSD